MSSFPIRGNEAPFGQAGRAAPPRPGTDASGGVMGIRRRRAMRRRVIRRVLEVSRVCLVRCLRSLPGRGEARPRRSSTLDTGRARHDRDGRPDNGGEETLPDTDRATAETQEAPMDEAAVDDAARRIGVDRMSRGALIAFVAEHRSTDPSGVEAAMRALERRHARGGRD